VPNDHTGCHRSRNPTGPKPAECGMYLPGHQMHFIHAKHLGLSPHEWRAATVTDATELSTGGHLLTVDYLDEPGWAWVWHHARVPDVCDGYPLRVHERLHALDVGAGWLNVDLVASSTPAHELHERAAAAPPLADTAGPVILDLGTGRAFPPEHPGLTQHRPGT
jgi:hypothetical protein